MAITHIPFISITDFMTREQVEIMRDVFLDAGGDKLPGNRRLAIGVMTSYKHSRNIPSKWDKAFPPRDQIASIFKQDPLLWNVLHYADYDGLRYSEDHLLRALAEELTLVTKLGGPSMDALQLDMVWPDPIAINRYRDRYPEKQVILQIGKNAMAQYDNDWLKVMNAMVRYEPYVDGFLLDKSMGRGVAMNANELLPYLKALSHFGERFFAIVAGGLGPNALDLVKPIIDEFPGVSLDAQGQLRPSGSALDPIDWQMAANYLRGAIKLFQK